MITPRIKKEINISNLKLDKLKRISNQNDIDSIICNDIDHKTPIYNISENQKIIAIGDIHGDLLALLLILFGAELINTDLEWIGKDTFVVFTGDLLDDYRIGGKTIRQHPADEITIISFLADLNTQAIKSSPSGRILLCLGNHELLNFENDFRYVNPNRLKKI